MEDHTFDIEKDNHIDSTRLSEEFRWLSVILFHYGQMKVEVQYNADLAEARYKEKQDMVYLKFKSDPQVKYTERQAEAGSKIDPEVIKLKNEYLDLKKEVGGFIYYLESLRFKKDMLIQLGADARKE